MNPQEISNHQFEKSARGYKPEEVDEYLRDVAIAYAKAVKDRDENEGKIRALVEKINEYRTDEDAIRDALLVAQKQGNRIVAEAKTEAERIIAEAQAQRDAILADIQNDCDTLKRNEIEKVAAAIRAENDKLSAVEAASKTQRELQSEKLLSLQKEVTDFKKKLIVILDKQIKLAVSLPELSDEQIQEILDAKAAPAPAEAEPAIEQPEAEAEKPEKSEKPEKTDKPDKTEPQKTPAAFGFSEYKRQNYSAEELKFGGNH